MIVESFGQEVTQETRIRGFASPPFDEFAFVATLTMRRHRILSIRENTQDVGIRFGFCRSERSSPQSERTTISLRYGFSLASEVTTPGLADRFQLLPVVNFRRPFHHGADHLHVVGVKEWAAKVPELSCSSCAEQEVDHVAIA